MIDHRDTTGGDCGRPETIGRTRQEGDANVSIALWTSKDVANALCIGERTLWRYVSMGEFPQGIRFGGCTRWPAEQVRAWIEERWAEATKETARRQKT